MKGLLLVVAATATGTGILVERGNMKSVDVTVQETVLAHIDDIFQAYLRKDREALRRTHTRDWVGFQGPSVKIERGIEDYMVNAEK